MKHSLRNPYSRLAESNRPGSGGGGDAPMPGSGGGSADDAYDPYIPDPQVPPGTPLFVWRAYSNCEVCVTNELEGPVEEGHVFPSGHTAPPAHYGCKCELTNYFPGHSPRVPKYPIANPPAWAQPDLSWKPQTLPPPEPPPARGIHPPMK
jgi:hypothetical protein